MADREKVMKGLQCLSSPYAQDMNGRDCENCQYDNASCFLDITADALALLKEQENYVSIPFSWLVKFCTHIDFREPMSDEERAERWKEKLSQQFGVNWGGV